VRGSAAHDDERSRRVIDRSLIEEVEATSADGKRQIVRLTNGERVIVPKRPS
jgi:hypothetical protein